MAGVPFHSVTGYLNRMVRAGHRVAVCEQMEDASQAKGVVRREVVRVVTPGTLTDESLLDEAEENPLAAVMFLDDDRVAIAYAELSTGMFRVAELRVETTGDELARIGPSELLYVETADKQAPERVEKVAQGLECSLTPRPAWQFRHAEATETLHRQFEVTTLTGFGLEEDDSAVGVAGAVVCYLLETQKASDGRLAHLLPPRRYEQANHLVIDQTSLRSLEIEKTLRSGEVSGSLLGTLQDCKTAMGKRMLRQWLCYPLNRIDEIERRQAAVGVVANDSQFSDDIVETLEPVQDVQRISSRIAIGRPSPRDLVALGRSMETVKSMKALLGDAAALGQLHKRIKAIEVALAELGELLVKACVEDPPAHMREGGLIAEGYDKQLDEFRALKTNASKYMSEYQAELSEATGISTLKLGYNKVFGYYIEVSHANSQKVPDTFTRKQTLKNAERYITPQLKEFEDKVLGASQKAIAREQLLFERLCKAAADRLGELHEYAAVVGELDVLACFARRAVRYGYVKPEMVDEVVLDIEDGRHPVLDELLADQFVPNNVRLGVVEGGRSDVGDEKSDPTQTVAQTSGGGDGPFTLGMITGPNMAGKSTYIRQAALLTLLAHTGSFIPAKSARIGLTDRIFTRIGASDEIHAGQSTFMVEMTETANICHHATDRSLVILDEIGRGTSTFDGLALAWAIAEYLGGKKCRTLFATHYHELTELAESFENITNLNVTVREWGNDVVFLHRISPGAAGKSYGIHVAKIAGLPVDVLSRANEVMAELETHGMGSVATGDGVHGGDHPGGEGDKSKEMGSMAGSGQMSLFTEFLEHPAVSQLREVDLENMTPMAAFDLLRRLREEMD